MHARMCECVRSEGKDRGVRGSRENPRGGGTDSRQTDGLYRRAQRKLSGVAIQGEENRHTWGWRVARRWGGSRHAADSLNVVEGEVTRVGRSGRVPGEG